MELEFEAVKESSWRKNIVGLPQSKGDAGFFWRKRKHRMEPGREENHSVEERGNVDTLCLSVCTRPRSDSRSFSSIGSDEEGCEAVDVLGVLSPSCGFP